MASNQLSGNSNEQQSTIRKNSRFKWFVNRNASNEVHEACSRSEGSERQARRADAGLLGLGWTYG